MKAIVGKFEHPLLTHELLAFLRDGKPCEIARSKLARALEICDSACSHADIDVRATGTKAELIPRDVRLNAIGDAYATND